MVKAKFILLLFFVSSFSLKAQIVSPLSECSRQKALQPTILNGINTDTLYKSFVNEKIHFTVREGLAQSLVNTIFVDSQDRLWIGTYGGGVSVFDGKKFRTLNKTHGLSNDVVWKFEEDNFGRIWIATDKGVSIFDGTKFEYIDETNGLEIGYVWSLFKDLQGRIWIGTAGGGAYLWDNGKITSFNHPNQLADNQIYQIAQKKSGEMVFATHGDGIIFLKDSVFLRNKFEKPDQNIIRSIFIDSYDKVWCGTDDGLMVLQDHGIVETVVSFPFESERIYEIRSDYKSVIRFSTSKGIVQLKNNKFSVLNEIGLPDDGVKSTFLDRWGGLWIATVNDGIYQLVENGFSHLSIFADESNVQPTALLNDSGGNIWIGSQNHGVFCFSEGKLIRYFDSESFKWSAVKSIYEDKVGNIWFGTSGSGIVKYDGVVFQNYSKQHGLGSNNIWTINQDKNGEMWFGTQWCAYRFDGNDFYYYKENCGFAYHQILSSYKDNDTNLWFGTFGGGATYYDGKDFYTIRDSHGLVNNSVLSITNDLYGNTWFSTYCDGISILKSGWKETSNLQWTTLNILNGLNDDNVKFMIPDTNGNIWIGTNKGLNKIILEHKNIFETQPEIETFGFSEGFTGIECFLNGGILDKNRSLWISSVNRLTRFVPQNRKIQVEPPHIILESLKLELKNVQWDSLENVDFSSINLWNNIPTNLELPYYQNHLQFEFIGICFDRPDKVFYQWKMLGFDAEWSPWSDAQVATYSNLPPGEYIFQIRAKNVDGIESKICEYKFLIHKPFWQMWWFRVVVIIISICSIWLLFRLRTKALRKRQEFVERTVDERTEELREQKHVVDEKQKEIIDSITYAKRIQNAILVNEEDIKHELDQSFLVYLPKDIVAGDFYFFEKHNNCLFIAAADCTGHGVPGALVSVVCSNALMRCVKEFNLVDPGKILEGARELIVETMQKSGVAIRDGMDISLCVFSLDSLELCWAGANNPLWIIRNESNSNKLISVKNDEEHSAPLLIEIVADKQPVGFSEHKKPFTTHRISHQHGDKIYLFTDGFADQFGGPKGKKYKYKTMAAFLLKIHHQPMPVQKQLLLAEFNLWKGDYEQLDDVCILGVSF